MIASSILKSACLAALCAVVTSCGGQPYVLNPGEFKRETVYYLHGLTDRATVEICYAKSETNAKVVRDLAIAECRRFGKQAIYRTTSYDVCPLTTPVAAVFTCVTSGTDLRQGTPKLGS